MPQITPKGLRILKVEEDSPAQVIGIEPGDRVLTINGHAVTDELELKFHLAEEYIVLKAAKRSGVVERYELDLTEGRFLGIVVEDFKTKTCNNSCLFCFVDQLPPVARSSLRIKDDDYRISLLHGNYITLTNLRERELDRIIEQAMSPLYVSVHATNPILRTQILGRKKTDDLEGKLNKLIRGGIKIHAQIVLMPGINDGLHLEETVFDLRSRFPGINSIAIVPLGLSDHGSPRELYNPVTASYCRRIIEQVSPWQDTFRSTIGRTFAYLADEFYIQADMPLPNTRHYDDFAQIEDGVGMVRKFLEDYDRELSRWRKPRSKLRGTLATGKLFYPYLKASAERFNLKFHSQLRVVEVENRFMGRAITVAGLLAAQDLAKGLMDRSLGDFVVIPNDAVSRIDDVLVDNLRVADLSRLLNLPVYTSGHSVQDFFRLICRKLGQSS